MEMKVNLTKEEETKLLERAKDEVRDELTEKAIEEFISANVDINLLELTRLFNISNKYENLKSKQIESLTRNDKFICMLYWIMYEKFI